METFMKDVIEQLKKTIAFIEKLKVEKKHKSERDGIVAELKDSIEKSKNFLKGEDEQWYNDVAPDTKPSDLYNDVQQDTYDELGDGGNPAAEDNSAIYDDTDNGGNSAQETYEDVSAQQIQMVECESLHNPTIAEYLDLKKAGKSFLKSSWQKKWCVLHKGVMYVYDNPKDKRQKEAFWISGYRFKFRDDIKDAKRKDRCFELRNKDKVHEFCANDKDSLTKWQCLLGGPRKSGSVAHSLNEENYDDVAPETQKGGIFPNGKKMPPKIPNQGDDSLYDDATGDVYEETGGMADATYDDTAHPTYDDTGRDMPPLPASEPGDIYEETESSPPPPPRSLPQLPTPGGSLPQRGRLSGKKELPPLPVSPKPPHGFPAGPALPPREQTGSASGTFAKNRPQMPLPGDNMNGAKRELPPPPSSDVQRAPSPALPPPPFDIASEPEEDDDCLEGFGESKDDYTNMYQGMWDCEPDEGNELRFKRGEIIHILSKEYDEYGWWAAESRHEEIGLVPVSYLMKAFDI